MQQNGKTALHVASQNGCVDVVSLLLDAHANMDLRDNVTILDVLFMFLNEKEWDDPTNNRNRFWV